MSPTEKDKRSSCRYSNLYVNFNYLTENYMEDKLCLIENQQ